MSHYHSWVPKYPPVRERCIRIATLYDSGTPVAEIARMLRVSEITVYRSIAPGRRLIAVREATEKLLKQGES
ncbi:helix-turn-helix domain-containing protein [Nocardiopsis dassonvillei]|uniref:helix-turn-helix domain-containing protein n=1 Tax=Nocardiopsis dassonvillei TaxID=2014 RepID=UPI003670B5A4